VKGSDPILEGELFNDIAKDDSSWTIGKSLGSADSRAGIHTDEKTMESLRLNLKRSRHISSPINGGPMS
jgi:hypothetical protein